MNNFMYLYRGAKAATIAVIFFAVFSLTPIARGQVTYVKSFGTPGTLTGQFADPFALAVSATGQVFVADYSNNRVQVLNTNLAYQASITTWVGGTTHFTGPSGVAVSSTGQVLVTDYGNSRVQVFGSNLAYQTSFGTPGTASGQFQSPEGIAVSPTGPIYVADTNNNRIQVFSSSLTYQSSFGTVGSASGQFFGPTGVAISAAGQVYVADTGNDRMEIFTSSGTFQSSFGDYGSGLGEFHQLTGVAVSATGQVFVADPGNARIEVFNSSGGYVTAFGSLGTGPGQLQDPYGVAVSATGEIFVADSVNNRIVKYFDPSEWVSGTPHFDTAAVGSGQLLGASLSMSSSQGLLIDGAMAIQAGGYLSTQGANVTAGTFTNSGQYYVTGGTVTVTGGPLNNNGSMTLNGGTVAASLNNNYGASFYATGTVTGNLNNNGTLTQSGLLSVNGAVANAGTVYISTGQQLVPASMTNSGVVNLSGGAIAGNGSFMNAAAGSVRGDGAITMTVTNQGGLIYASGGNGLTLSSFVSNQGGGELRVAEGDSLTVLAAAGGNWANSSIITLDGPNSVLNGDTINNSATISGQGRITNMITNLASGTIRANGGQLVLAGLTTNSGTIQASSGNSVVVSQGLASNSGLIALAGGTFDNNSLGMLNSGSIEGSGIVRTGGLIVSTAGNISVADAPTSFYGSVTNDGSIKMINTTTTFYGAVTNDLTGTIKNTSGTARFLSTFTNNGTYNSDPADNYFTSLPIGSTGALIGGVGDNFIISGDLISSSSNPAWNTTGAALRFNGAGGHTLNFSAQAGPLTFNSLTVDAGNTLSIIAGAGGRLDVQGLNLPGSATLTSGLIVTHALNFSPGSTLDLTSNPLILEAASAAAKPGAIAQLAAEVLSGRNGGAWNGPGITSSTVAANSAHFSIAVADNALLGYSTFGGQSVDSNSILVGPALLGDANLDGTVNAADFAILSTHFGQANAGWAGADFNGDGVVNFADFAALSNNFGDTIGASEIPSANTSSLSGVPEPSSLVLLGLSLLGMSGSRRRARVR